MVLKKTDNEALKKKKREQEAAGRERFQQALQKESEKKYPGQTRGIERGGTTRTFDTREEYNQAITAERQAEVKQKYDQLKIQRELAGGMDTTDLSYEEFKQAQAQDLAQQEEEEVALAGELEAKGSFKEAPTDPLKFVTSRRLDNEKGLPATNLPTKVLFDLTSKIPGFQEVADNVGNEIGLSNKRLQEFRELNPDEYERYEREITKELLLKKNKTITEKFKDRVGILADGIPIAGKGASAVGFTTPSAKITDIKGTIGKVDSVVDSEIQLADTSPYQALQNLNEQEEALTRYEARLQLLVMESYSVKNNPDEVDNIRAEIGKAYTKIQRGREQITGKILQQQEEPDSFVMKRNYEKMRKLAKSL